MTDRDETYNGWTNYPTWCVNLWLSNDQGLTEATVEMVAGVVATGPVEGSVLTEKEQLRYCVSDVIRQWVSDELAPDLGASFPADLLNYSLSLVNWDEIADGWIITYQETARDERGHSVQA